MAQELFAATPETVKVALDRILYYAGWVVKLTPTQTDDKLVQALQSLSNQPWFTAVLAELLNAFGPTGPVTHEQFKKILANHPH